MILPDRMFSADWIRDLRLRRLPSHVQLLLIFLRPLCDRNGRFEFNPKLIHRALYESAECRNVSVRDVEAWLEILRAGDFIKSYTGATGRRVGEMATEYWRQKLNYGKDVFEAEADRQPELPLPASEPPEKKISKRGGGKKSPPPFTSNHFISPAPVDLTLEGLQRAYPHLDVPAEARAAERRQRRLQGSDYQLDLLWFAEHWLAKAGPKLGGGIAGAVGIPAEPEAWRLYLKDHQEGESWATSAATMEWTALPPQWRDQILAGMKRTGRAA